MELEKAIEELKRTIEENDRLLDQRNEQFFNKKERKEIETQNSAISAVLQALDNSIPKEKVLEQMQKLNDLANDPKQEYYYANYRYTMNALEDLLGEDSSNTVTEIFRSKARLAPIETGEKRYE